MTTYVSCPNGCGGEVPCEPEMTDDGAADIYGATSYVIACIDEEANARSHEPGCPPLTSEQIAAIEEYATLTMSEPEYGELEP